MGLTQHYLDAVQAELRTGVAREHSYRPALKNYLEALLPDVQAVNEPAQQKCGAPDFVISKKRKDAHIPVGYIEAKDISVNLDATENKKQLNRYLASLDNLIHTDYIEFRFYKERELVATVSIADLVDGKLVSKAENYESLESLLVNFAEYIGQTIKSPRVLAEMMARKARLMRDVFYQAVSNTEEVSGLHEQLEGFRKILIHDMDEEQFADVYAQTIAYGLFTARLHDTTLEDFSRQEARDLIPKSNPFLRQLFDYVCGADMDDGVAWIIDELCEVYRATNVADILSDFNKNTGRNDPIVHFYETFLGAYDPKLRKARGVWYTPESVVNFIVRAIDEVLKTHFNISDGILDTGKVTIEVDSQTGDKRRKTGKKVEQREVHRVQMLDVATGTGSFMAEVVKQIHDQFIGQQGMWSNYVEEHLLPRLHGFEILMASYAMCHLKLDLLLGETGYTPSNPKNPPRLGAYLANSLEEHHPDVGTLFASWLAHEANEASHIKRDMPVMVAFGNPPYSGSSQNKGKWIESLISDYKQDLKEANINALSDDYVKFIRYAEHHIEKTGYGIVAMITNNSFIDGVTHRQMRKHLLETFDHIYIYNLHGNSKIKEKCPDGSPDKNVFDITVGVCISLFIKSEVTIKNKLAHVKYYDSYGPRKVKYDKLWEQSLSGIDFHSLNCESPNYFFVPKTFKNEEEYNSGFSASKLFLSSGNGIKFRKDNLLVKNNYTKQHAIDMIEDVQKLPTDVLLEKYSFSETVDWQHQDQIEYFNNYDLIDIHTVSYRPFDRRYTYYPIALVNKIIPRGDSRHNLMRHLSFGDNESLLLGRQGQVVGNMPWNLVFCSRSMTDMNEFYRGGTITHPLYLYPQENIGGELALSDEDAKRKPNFDMAIVDQIAANLGLSFIPDHENTDAGADGTFTPLDLLDYIYAVLHSPNYRETELVLKNCTVC